MTLPTFAHTENASVVGELTGTTSDDFPSWLSPDRCTILFTSDRGGGNGGQDIWMATRSK